MGLFSKKPKLDQVDDAEVDAMVEQLRHDALASLERSIRAADAAEQAIAHGAPVDCAEVREVREAIHEANESVRAFMGLPS